MESHRITELKLPESHHRKSEREGERHRERERGFYLSINLLIFHFSASESHVLTLRIFKENFDNTYFYLACLILEDTLVIN